MKHAANLVLLVLLPVLFFALLLHWTVLAVLLFAASLTGQLKPGRCQGCGEESGLIGGYCPSCWAEGR